MSRYNPATNRKTKVPKGSVEDLTWPHRKPAKTVSGLLSQSVDLANQPGGSTAAAVDYLKGKVLTKVEKKAVLTLKKAAAKGSAVAASIIGEAAGVSGSALVAASLAALAAGVGLGLATVYGADNQRDLLTRQYHEALHAVARVTSDPATAKKAMAKIKAKYLESLARIGAADPTIGIRPGME